MGVNNIWRELVVSPEEQEMVEEICRTGAGKSLAREELERFSVGREWDIEVDTRVGKTLVHMYWPEKTVEKGRKIPLFINIHGGGFIKGRRDQDIVFCRNVCSRAHIAIADIDYVPAPAMRYPGQVYACYDVLQYFGENADSLGIDRKRIGAGGHSAGGNLTAAAILMAIDSHGFVPALQILDYAGLDMKTPPGEKRNGTSNPKIPVWKAEFYNKMYVDPEDAGEIYCSPLFASDQQLAKMPETLILYCDNDTFCDEGEMFQRRLLAQGVPVYGKRFFHSSHGFVVQRKDEYREAERMILAVLRNLSTEEMGENVR